MKPHILTIENRVSTVRIAPCQEEDYTVGNRMALGEKTNSQPQAGRSHNRFETKTISKSHQWGTPCKPGMRKPIKGQHPVVDTTACPLDLVSRANREVRNGSQIVICLPGHCAHVAVDVTCARRARRLLVGSRPPEHVGKVLTNGPRDTLVT